MIQAAIRPLAEHPLLYRQGRVEGTREVVVHPNYIVVYRPLATHVEIIAVLHARRRYP